MSGSLTIFLTDHGPAGHAYIGLSNDNGKTEYRGFYPKAAATNDVEAAQQTFLEHINPERMLSAGDLRDNTQLFNSSNKSPSAPIPLTDTQYNNVKLYIEQVEKSPGTYFVDDHNCADFANGALKAAGLKGDIADHFTLEQLQHTNMTGIYVNAKYGDAPLNYSGEKFALDHMPSKAEWAAGQPVAPAGNHLPPEMLRALEAAKECGLSGDIQCGRSVSSGDHPINQSFPRNATFADVFAVRH